MSQRVIIRYTCAIYLFIYFLEKNDTALCRKLKRNNFTGKKYEHYILMYILMKEWQLSHCIRVYYIPLQGHHVLRYLSVLF